MEIDTGTTELLCSVRDGVALITLNRPEARNAMSDKLTPALRTQIRERGEDAGVGAILITGAGTAFCSGGDVKGMAGRGPRGQMTFEERQQEKRRNQEKALERLRHLLENAKAHAAAAEAARTSGAAPATDLVLEALARGAGVGDAPVKYRRLCDLAGAWQEDRDFDEALREQDRVDESLWL